MRYIGVKEGYYCLLVAAVVNKPLSVDQVISLFEFGTVEIPKSNKKRKKDMISIVSTYKEGNSAGQLAVMYDVSKRSVRRYIAEDKEKNKYQQLSLF